MAEYSKQIDEVRVGLVDIVAVQMFSALTRRTFNILLNDNLSVYLSLLLINSCANRFISDTLVFKIPSSFVEEGRKNRRRNGSLIGWGIVGGDPPSGPFCTSQFELQIGR